MFLAGAFDGLIILLVVVGTVGAIAGVSYLIYRFLNPKLKSEKETPDEEAATQQELDRVLEPIEDDAVAEQVANYEENDD